MRNRTKQILAAAMVAVSVTGVILAQPAPDGPGTNGEIAPPPPAEPTAMKGTVTGMNFGPDGDANGLFLKAGDGPATQVNFPPHVAASIAKVVKTGTSVSVMTRPLPPKPPRPGDNGPGPKGPDGKGPGPKGPDASGLADRPAPPPAPPADHPVVELVSLTPDGGTEIAVPRPEDVPTTHVDGIVARLNYTRDGQPDGAVLEDGTLIHTGPGEAMKLKLAVGQKLSVDGVKPPKATADAKVLQATKVNGESVERPRPRRPEDGPGAPPPPGM